MLDSNITTRLLASIEESLEELKDKPIIAGDPDRHEKTIPGNVIKKEGTVFCGVPHDNGVFDTDWVYPDGASADQRPQSQYCYWLSPDWGSGTAQTRIDITHDGVPLANISTSVPDLEEVLRKCTWWNGSIN